MDDGILTAKRTTESSRDSAHMITSTVWVRTTSIAEILCSWGHYMVYAVHLSFMFTPVKRLLILPGISSVFHPWTHSTLSKWIWYLWLQNSSISYGKFPWLSDIEAAVPVSHLICHPAVKAMRHPWFIDLNPNYENTTARMMRGRPYFESMVAAAEASLQGLL